LLLYIGKR